MNKQKQRYKILPINLAVPQVRPLPISITGAKQVIVIRYEYANGINVPNNFYPNWFQLSIDDSNNFIPVKPYDAFKVLNPISDSFHTLYYRNLRVMPTGCWIFLMIVYDLCFEARERNIIPVPLKTFNQVDLSSTKDYSSRVAINAAATGVICTASIPTSSLALLWSFEVFSAGTAITDWEVRLVFGATPVRVWTRNTLTYLSTLAASFSGYGCANPDNVIMNYPYPLEIYNLSAGAVALELRVYNYGGNNESFTGSMEISYIPIYLNYILPQEAIAP
jgi:hypothetical protein